MILRNFKQNPRAMMLLGMVFLALANLSNVLLRRSGLVSENTRDFIFGMLMGLAIATLLVSVVKRRTSPPRS